ncbi:hypothetical protein HDU67_004529 [Dinochytrium kinnereticum]|nr:hypothetical protein HDU67_004529 [Dinochytrium kinnereticum]
MKAALRDVLTASSILPDVKVNLIKVNIWDPAFYRPADAYRIDSGGFSSAALYDAIHENEVVGVIGDRYSQTTSASVSSQLKVPFCGPSQTSPLFSDKRSYEYFWRMQTGIGIGEHLVRLLQNFQATQVILVGSATNTLSIAVQAEAHESFTRNGILVAGKLVVTRSMMSSKNLSPGEIDSFYYAAAKEGLVGPKYVWIGNTWPFITPPDAAAAEKIALIEGFVQLWAMPAGSQNYGRKRYVKQFWAQMARSYPQWYLPGNPAPSSRFGAGVYDCVKTFLIGLDKVLRENSTLTPKNLSQPEIRSTLNISKFANTGYSGISSYSESIELTEEGDLKMPYLFVTTNATQTFLNFTPELEDGFLFSGMTGSIELKKPVFHGGMSKFISRKPIKKISGSKVPPPSHPIRQAGWISSSLMVRYAVKTLQYLTASITTYALWSQILQIIRREAMHIPFHLFLIAGSSFLLVPNFTFSDGPSSIKCEIDPYWEFSGITLINSFSVASHNLLFLNDDSISKLAIYVAMSFILNLYLCLTPFTHFEACHIGSASASVMCIWSIAFWRKSLIFEQDFVGTPGILSATNIGSFAFETKTTFGWSRKRRAVGISLVTKSSFILQLVEVNDIHKTSSNHKSQKRSREIHVIVLRNLYFNLIGTVGQETKEGLTHKATANSSIVLGVPGKTIRIYTPRQEQLDKLFGLFENSLQSFKASEKFDQMENLSSLHGSLGRWRLQSVQQDPTESESRHWADIPL